MSYDLGKKLVAGGFFLTTLLSVVRTVMSMFMQNMLELTPLAKAMNAVSVASVVISFAIVAGFALMWFMGGNLLDLFIGGTMIVGWIVSDTIPRYFGTDAYTRGWGLVLLSALSALYLLVWAYKYLAKNPMMSILLGGVFLIGVFADPILNWLASDIGISSVIITIIFSIPLTIACGGVRIFAAMTESEK